MLEVPAQLTRVEFVRVRFRLEFQKRFHLRRETLLRLRTDLRRAAGRVLAGETARGLFDPPLSSDPVALRRFQRPGPPFVLSPMVEAEQAKEAGDWGELPVLFLGRGCQLLESFAETLQILGPSGLVRGEGRFELAEIVAEDPSGNRLSLWREGQALRALAPPICDARWWAEGADAGGRGLRLRFLTPARLLSAGKPMFRPDFGSLFPFILRRVTSMLFAHCGVEVVEDPRPLLRAARQVRIRENRLKWEDWRVLEGPESRQELGGVMGDVDLEATGLEEILWLLHLGSLFNLGKGATYGAGQFRLMNSEV